jgi:Cu-Zn family superoxide dismutase
VGFYDIVGGTMVFAQIYGLPEYKPSVNGAAQVGPFGFHIHENSSCEVGDHQNPFTAAGGHWNPFNQPHGNHAGDFPVLFSNNGYSYMSFFTSKFKPQDVIGKAVLIHESPDDYRTQPAGNSGKRIGCGLIVPFVI